MQDAQAPGEGTERVAPLWKPIVWGLAITLGQTLGLCLLSGQPDPQQAYRSLLQWDSRLYLDISERGYRSTVPPIDDWEASNVAFFPGYPFFARAVALVSPR